MVGQGDALGIARCSRCELEKLKMRLYLKQDMINMKVSLSPHLNIAGIVHPDLMGEVLHHLGRPRPGAAHHVLEPEYLFLELIQFTTLFI